MPSIFQNLGQDLLPLAWMFLVRIALPLAVVIGVGWLLWRYFAPGEAIERRIHFSEFLLNAGRRIRPIQLPNLSAGQIFMVTTVGLLWVAAAGFIIARFLWGLGATTALTDVTPWGLWIGFDVMSGVALAAGGFTLAATVYIFRLERYRPILRPAILTALLGYTLVIIALLLDLGRWYNIWHPLVMWNPHSVMFEVAWCVMLYTTVLALEFSPVVWERFHVTWALKWLHKIIIPLVILGVVLSTLHQSSLGSLYLIFATKLSPMWYTPMLPVLFFLSALAVGLATVMLEAALTAKAFRHSVENDMMASLGKPAAIIIAIYLAVRVGDLVARGMTPALLTLSFLSAYFWVQVTVGLLVPLVIFANKRWRENPRTRLAAAVLVVAYVLSDRLNVSVIGFYDYASRFGSVYIPSVGEWVVTLAIVTAGIAAYMAFVKIFPVLPVPEAAAQVERA